MKLADLVMRGANDGGVRDGWLLLVAIVGEMRRRRPHSIFFSPVVSDDWSLEMVRLRGIEAFGVGERLDSSRW
ncbi:hypothetical protein CASFOL_042957 [Castilleja foliolosa]|uniref:Uncharacterized protein n=1 Tax=Castilleja foliolosa TaxID=1961234 RepID=A0ABD3B7G2_9LAMI